MIIQYPRHFHEVASVGIIVMGLAHVIFPIILENLKGPFMHGGSARFSPTLLVEVEGNQLIRLDVSHPLASV